MKEAKKTRPVSLIGIVIGGLILFCTIVALLVRPGKDAKNLSSGTPLVEATEALSTAAIANPTAAPSTTSTAAAKATVTPGPSLAPTVTSTPRPTDTPTLTILPTSTPEIRVEAQVVDVVDGDTIKVEVAGAVYTVRYIGIDTPETVHPSEPVGWMGPEASEANKQLVAGQTVLLEKDVSETDKYGRLLRYVWVGDLMVNAELVRQGYAQVSTYPPDVKYQDQFLQLQREAQEAERGLWAPAPTATVAPQPAPTAPAPVIECPYIGNANTGKFHHASCRYVSQMNPGNKVCLPSRDEAIRRGFVACKVCKP